MNVLTKQQRIAELAKQKPEVSFTSLNHYLDVDWLKEAYRRLRKGSAPGCDGQTVRTSKFIGHCGGIENTKRYTARRDVEKKRELQSEIVIPDTPLEPLTVPKISGHVSIE
ncbi:MAG TPA: hypothetical protein DCP92_05970 [Nitrospiraceae bacterium]|nr:hypothetical protein [Nitrospiraceae bacterium]